MSLMLRYEYLGMKRLAGTYCGEEKDMNASMSQYFAEIGEELRAIELQGVPVCEPYSNQWYGPGSEGRKKEEVEAKVGTEWIREYRESSEYIKRAEEQQRIVDSEIRKGKKLLPGGVCVGYDFYPKFETEK
jgi:hypothetical protein